MNDARINELEQQLKQSIEKGLRRLESRLKEERQALKNDIERRNENIAAIELAIRDSHDQLAKLEKEE